MIQKAMIDTLADTISKVEAWCADAKVALIPGALDDLRFQMAHFEAWTGAPDDEYLALLGRLNVSALVIRVRRLSEERWQRQVTKLRNLPEHMDRDTRLHQAEQLRPYVGHVAEVQLRAFLTQPQMILSHEIFAPWHSEFVQLDYEEDEDEEATSEDGVDLAAAQRNNDFARQLATHPRFPFAKNFEKRRYLAESVFKAEDIDGNDISDIVRRAEIIYDVDIKS